MIVTIHQPSYLPWIPFLEKGLRSDVYVMLDTVQFEKNSEQNRNQIKTANGACWLTVPVSRTAKSLVSEVEIASENWQAKHCRAIQHSYAKSPYFEEVSRALLDILNCNWSHLVDLNLAIDRYFLELAQFSGRIVFASELAVAGENSERILNICRALGATKYLSGASGCDYLDLNAFDREGIDVLFQGYRHRPYPQLHPKTGFIPRLSALDLFMNVGVGEGAHARILSSSRWYSSAQITSMSHRPSKV